jgi:hypothetical protein
MDILQVANISPFILINLDRDAGALYDPGDPITICATVSGPVHLRLLHLVHGV